MEVHDINELITLIDNIPKILQYFVPGYLSLIIFTLLCGRKISQSLTLILSCVLSYLILSFTSLFVIDSNIFELSAICCGISIVGSVVFSLFYTSAAFAWILSHVFYKTVNEDIWHDVFDYKNGTNLKVYFKGKDYYVIGQYRGNEDSGEESWFAISGYGKYDIVTNDPIDDSLIDDTSVIMTFRLSDVEHIEVFRS